LTPTSAGDYWWYASYGGDLSNYAARSACGAGMAETVVRLPPPPRNESLPAISGAVKDGLTLKTTPGTWSSPQKLTYTYQWRRCTRTGTSCANINKATHASYKLTSTDVGHKITVVVAATDPEHQTAHATAKPVGPIKG
jgi:endo-1,4-beta-xylanase